MHWVHALNEDTDLSQSDEPLLPDEHEEHLFHLRDLACNEEYHGVLKVALCQKGWKVVSTQIAEVIKKKRQNCNLDAYLGKASSVLHQIEESKSNFLNQRIALGEQFQIAVISLLSALSAEAGMTSRKQNLVLNSSRRLWGKAIA